MTKYIVYKSIRKAIIYKIVCNKTGLVYVGSTTETLHERIRKHKDKKCACKTILEQGDFEAAELEHFYTKFRFAVLLKEQWYQDNIKCINKRRAIPSFEQIKATAAKYRIKNKDKIKKQKQIYNVKYKVKHKEQIKKYRDNHKEYIKIKNKKYKDEHKERIKKHRKIYDEKTKDKRNNYRRDKYRWVVSMGGDPNNNNNITRIDMTLFD
jgi:hypothetical protein